MYDNITKLYEFRAHLVERKLKCLLSGCCKFYYYVICIYTEALVAEHAQQVVPRHTTIHDNW